jgi:hypothetical protein
MATTSSGLAAETGKYYMVARNARVHGMNDHVRGRDRRCFAG